MNTDRNIGKLRKWENVNIQDLRNCGIEKWKIPNQKQCNIEEFTNYKLKTEHLKNDLKM